ncbi:hypothetical protein [Aquimarina longa]|uniref:hypothetical protein n=1 Tax=Aquimarina longa TaxID=1080221 RepID=UPI000783201D|nr:hypothetical protein [Aquimarina longa]
MFTVIIFSVFLAVFFLYNTSKNKVSVATTKLENWFQDNYAITQISGVVFLVVSLLISIAYYGLGSGIFIWFVTLMVILGLVIILYPLHFITIKTTLPFLILVLILEIIFI